MREGNSTAMAVSELRWCWEGWSGCSYQENYSEAAHVHTFSIWEICGSMKGQCFQWAEISVLLYHPINVYILKLNPPPLSLQTDFYTVLYCKCMCRKVLVDVVHIRPSSKRPIKQNYKTSVFTRGKWLSLKILGNEFATKQNTENRSHNMVGYRQPMEQLRNVNRKCPAVCSRPQIKLWNEVMVFWWTHTESISRKMFSVGFYMHTVNFVIW